MSLPGFPINKNNKVNNYENKYYISHPYRISLKVKDSRDT